MDEIKRTEVRALLPARPPESSKATFGHVLAIAGSDTFRGAASLCAASVLRIGAGYVTVACPRVVADAVSRSLPDAVLLPLRSRRGCVRGMAYRKVMPAARRATAIAFGCGLSNLTGGTGSVRRFFRRIIGVLSALETPVVLDADGINFLAELQPLALPKNLILTPHERELSRLLRIDVAEVHAEREACALAAAKAFGAVVVLKGHRTLVTDGERTCENATGNSALAKAGSGDVLAGTIAGLCAQGLAPFDAARAGVFLHGLAGEIASSEKTEYGALSSELPAYLPRAVALALEGKKR